jgi:hypothetical protein
MPLSIPSNQTQLGLQALSNQTQLGLQALSNQTQLGVQAHLTKPNWACKPYRAASEAGQPAGAKPGGRPKGPFKFMLRAGRALPRMPPGVGPVDRSP